MTDNTQDALKIIHAMKQSQPGIHVDILERGFRDLWVSATSRAIDQRILESELATDLPSEMRMLLDSRTTADSHTWGTLLGVSVIDADGWDRENLEESFNAKISRDEYIIRMMSSTVQVLPWSPLK